MSLKCLVVDDEALAITLLEKYISQVDGLELLASTKDPVKAIEILEEETIDILFLDIQMPELTGIELLRVLPQKPVVILTTAYSEYAVEGYQLDVTDYLLKPFSLERFIQAVDKAKRVIDLSLQALKNAGEISMHEEKKYINVKADHKIYKIPFDDIKYIEGLKEYVSFYTNDQRIIALESLKKLEILLPSTQFMRVHKSYIIAVNKVRALEGNLLEIGDKKIPIGKTYRQEVIKKIFGEDF
ncbi:LytR/AlgR family response regulator transcription factor [Chondrinema litorale]|uniref:LytR/AlgR family response regulator transcription factor n=1 Tax=Chondrinema litorale TaxID=2994555 RepID=UPI0025428290|nr:LytTR family DNA-binding domain-containing protein [Chondrinema litorale]UZR95759.1 LytTR family DNA-binding domain-containing protein [Chondrinema litorale]